MSDAQRGSVPYVFEELKANIAENSILSASGRTIEIVVAKNVAATLDFTYYPAISGRMGGAMEDGDTPSVRFHGMKSVEDVRFEGLHMDLIVKPGCDLIEFLDEHEIEVLEEMIIKRADRA